MFSSVCDLASKFLGLSHPLCSDCRSRQIQELRGKIQKISETLIGEVSEAFLLPGEEEDGSPKHVAAPTAELCSQH